MILLPRVRWFLRNAVRYNCKFLRCIGAAEDLLQVPLHTCELDTFCTELPGGEEAAMALTDEELTRAFTLDDTDDAHQHKPADVHTSGQAAFDLASAGGHLTMQVGHPAVGLLPNSRHMAEIAMCYLHGCYWLAPKFDLAEVTLNKDRDDAVYAMHRHLLNVLAHRHACSARDIYRVLMTVSAAWDPSYSQEETVNFNNFLSRADRAWDQHQLSQQAEA